VAPAAIHYQQLARRHLRFVFDNFGKYLKGKLLAMPMIAAS
jgi:hypothetical protein